MKRLLLLLMMLLLLTGCATTAKLPEVLPEEFDNSGEKTVVFRGERSFSLAYSVDGQPQIPNGTYWYYELETAYEKDWDENFYTYGLKDRELNGSVNYTELKNCYATNGNWPLFLYPVHTEYTASNQSGVEASVAEAASKQLPSAVVTDVWSCDMDGDTVQELLFEAENAEQRMIGYLKEGVCQGLYVGQCKKITPLVCDLNGDGRWELILYSEADFKRFSVYDFDGGNFNRCYEILF